MSIHLNVTKMYHDLKKFFGWTRMKKEVVQFVYACLTCQKLKIKHQKSLRLMQPLSIPELKWDRISMDFVTSFLNTTKGRDSIWVIIYRLTKSTHFKLINICYPLQKMVELYIEKVVSLYGISLSIMSNRDLRFTLRFW